MIDKNYAADRLREMFPVGSTARTKVLHVSRSGMSRTVAVVGVDPKTGEAEDVSYLVAAVTGMSFDRNHGGVKVGGVGMDMAFHVVYSMSRTLYPDGHRCTGHDRTETRRNGRKVRRCPSNDHTNGDREYRRGKLHSDGGYAISKASL